MNLNRLNKVQRQAVEAVEGPVLIFAGAGSGKTRVLTYKIAHLIKQELYKPENILAVTFTNKAAQEMRTRVAAILQTDEIMVKIGTFHAIGAFILRHEIGRLGFSSNYAIYDVQDQMDLLRIILDQENISKDYIRPQVFRSAISKFKNQMKSPESLENTVRNIKEKKIIEVYRIYETRLKENDAVDFDDLLTLPIKVFKENPTILKKYQNRWKYILVDEYQDTNLPQFKLISLLSANHKNVSVVGDDDQSIYGWRGADIKNILNFEKVFSAVTTFKLEKNYRSTQEILDAAGAVVRNNENRAEKTLVASRGSGELVGLTVINDDLEEGDAVVSILQKEVKQKKRKLKDFAILYRTNAQSRSLEDSLMRNGIPYNIVGGIRFFDRKEVKDVLSYLRLITNLKDTIALRRVVNFPPRGIGLKTIDKCVTQAGKDKVELFDVLNDPTVMDIRGKQIEALKFFHDLIIKYRKLLDKLSPRELVTSLIEETGIIRFFKDADTQEERERIDNIEELLKSVDEYSRLNPEGSLSGYIDEVSLLTNIDRWNDNTNRVTLMTVHAAKGLEFPIVFITGLEEGLFPLYRSLDSQEALEEERRLFYVALTRAKSKAVLLYATSRRRMGSDYEIGIPSRFINEIPAELLENIQYKSALTRKVVSHTLGKTEVKITRSITNFDDFKVGDTVGHAIFGDGVIMALSGTGENQRVAVVFKDGTKKKLIVKYANLKKN